MRLVVAIVLLVGLAFAGLVLADPSAVTVSGSTATVTGPSTTILNFPVTRTGDTSFDGFVQYQTMDGSAVGEINYSPAAESLLIPAGASSASIPVNIAGSTLNHPDLTFQLLLLGGGGGSLVPDFTPQERFVTGKLPQAVAMVDLNGDGKPDLVVANQGDNAVSVMLNYTVPGGSIPSFSGQTFATGNGPSAVAAADLNGDGIPDLVIANYVDNTVSVLFNTTATGASTLSLAAQKTFATGNGPSSIAIADINGDGLRDLIVANLLDGTVSVLLNTTPPGAATPSFAAQKSFAVGAAPRSVATADFNRDGMPDLVFGNSTSNTISVLLNTTSQGASTPSFAAQQTFATGNGPSSVAAADVNQDGMPDVIAVNQSDATVSVLLNAMAPGASTASFANQQTFATGIGPAFLAVADINGDAKSDLIVANSSDRTLSVLLNVTAPGAARPSFATQQTFATGGDPVSIAVADVNDDNKLDLAVCNFVDNTVSVLLNLTALPTTTFDANSLVSEPVPGAPFGSVALADMNGDGKSDLITSRQDASAMLNTTPPGATTATFAAPQIIATSGLSADPADVNGDGKPDLIVTTSSTLSVLLNTTPPGATTLTFAAPQSVSVSNSGRVVVADVNGDGKADLVVGQSGFAAIRGGTVTVFLNTTPPGSSVLTFAAPQTFGGTVSSDSSPAVADVNADGKLDLVYTSLEDGTVSVMLNNAAPGATTLSFGVLQSFSTISFPGQPVAVDINGDGMPDLAVPSSSQDEHAFSVLLNTTARGATVPTFAVQQTFATGRGNSRLAAADLNGDGRPDLMAENGFFGILLVLINATPRGATTASFAPQLAFPNQSTNSIAAADINGDGQPDLVVGTFPLSVMLDALYQTTVSGSPATGTIHYNVTNPSPTATPTPTPTPTLTPTPTATPTVSATLGFAPARVHFGKVRVNQLRSRTVKMTNEAPQKGGATIFFGTFSISGSNAFSLFHGCTSLAPKQKCTVTVRFVPTSEGAAKAVLTVNDNARNAPQTILLTGTGK